MKEREIEQLKRQVKDLGDQIATLSSETASETGEAVKEELHQLRSQAAEKLAELRRSVAATGEKTKQLVQDKPIESMVVATLFGLIAGALLFRSRKSH